MYQDKQETRTRHILKRAKRNYRVNPTHGRLLAIKRYEFYLRRRELWRLVRLNPNLAMTTREVVDYLYGPINLH